MSAADPDRLLKTVVNKVAAETGKRPAQNGERFDCLCPAHDDHNPSLTVSKGNKGILLTCHANCDTEDVAAAIGMEMGDLFYDNGHERDKPDCKAPVATLADIRGWAVQALRALGAEADGGRVRFPMKDAEGDVLGHKLRRGDNHHIELQDGRTVKSKTQHGSKNGLMYPGDLGDRPGPVCLTESEADAAAILTVKPEAAVIATPGANPPERCKDALCELCEERSVVLFPDPDSAGTEWKDTVGRWLQSAACSIRMVEPDGVDIDDRLQDGADLDTLRSNAKKWTPPGPDPESFFDGKAFRPSRLAREITNRNTLRYGFDPDSGEGRLMEWNGRLWKPAATLRKKARHLLKHRAKPTYMREGLQTAECDVAWEPWENWDGLPDNKVACLNGLVNLDTGEVEPHDKQYLYRSCIPWRYRPNADSEALERALGELFPDCEVLKAALKLAGYCLVPHTRAKVFAFLKGDTDSGKTTFLEWLRALVGEDACASKTPQDLTETRFASAALEGKLLNAPDELTNLSLRSVERLKSLSGGGSTFDCEHKGQDSYEAPMTATLVFACNDLPTGAGEADDAYYNRLLIIPFENSFPDGDPALRNEWPERADIMEPFLALAVAGLIELRDSNWHFDKPEAIQREIEDYRAENDPVAAFVEHRCTVQAKAQVKRTDFYAAFEDYCHERDLRCPSRRRVYERLRTEWQIEEPTRNGIDWLRGVGLKA
mgnify:CR=1 FL=1